jgi:rubredoxin
MFRCPDCGGDMVERVVITRLGDIDRWNCTLCDSFYDKKEMKKMILSA